MTDEAQIHQQTVVAIIKGVTKKTALLTSCIAAAVLVNTLVRGSGQRWWFIPASILIGGALGLLNFRLLAKTVERFFLRDVVNAGASTVATAILSIIKLTAIFIILFVLIKLGVLHIFGLLGGFSLSFLAILWEGLALKNDVFGRVK